MAENDVFSALNVGSGLNTTELIKNLSSFHMTEETKEVLAFELKELLKKIFAL